MFPLNNLEFVANLIILYIVFIFYLLSPLPNKSRARYIQSKMVFQSASLALILALAIVSQLASVGLAQGPPTRPRLPNRNKQPERPILKDAFHEDYKAIVRIRTSYNSTTSVTCNGVLMDSPTLVLSDVSCIKYQGMANIDARYVQVITGEQYREVYHDVDQIFINKANPNDPSTELALLKLKKGIEVESPCTEIRPPQLNTSASADSHVRVVGFTSSFELKENRTQTSKRIPLGSDKYLCTSPSDLNETPGSQLLRGAPLLAPVDCKVYHMVGILTKIDVYFDGATKKQQDCFVMVNSQMRWYNQVRTLATLAAKNDGGDTAQPSVVVVSVDN